MTQTNPDNNLTSCKCGAPLYSTTNDWSGVFCKKCGWSPQEDEQDREARYEAMERRHARDKYGV